jgi:Protein of unknown function (DUF3105)
MANKKKSANKSRRPATRPSYADRPAGKTVASAPAKKDNSLLLIAGAGVSVIACAVILFLIFSGGGNSSTTANPNPSGGGEIPVVADPNARVETFPDQGNDHLQPNQPFSGTYNSNPPTSGPHDAIPIFWGVYYTPQRDEALVHNLEHGGIVIHLDCGGGCPQAYQNLSAYANRYPRDTFTGIILAPRSLPDGARISLTAWRNRLLLKSLDVPKINDFIANYFNKGPERAG